LGHFWGRPDAWWRPRFGGPGSAAATKGLKAAENGPTRVTNRLVALVGPHSTSPWSRAGIAALAPGATALAATRASAEAQRNSKTARPDAHMHCTPRELATMKPTSRHGENASTRHSAIPERRDAHSRKETGEAHRALAWRTVGCCVPESVSPDAPPL
jgi:hypothetical protein